MKRFFLVLLLVALVLLLAAVTHGATEITLDEVDGIFSGDTVLTGNPLRFILRWTYAGNCNKLHCFRNTIRVWTHQNGAYTDNFDPATQDTLTVTPPWRDMFLGVGFNWFGVDGIGEDTLAFFGGTLIGDPGLPEGFDQQAWWIATTPTGGGDTLCIDSCSYIQDWDNYWVWYTSPSGCGEIVPDWSGPHCFYVAECCIGSLGNVDLRGGVNVADLVMLAAYLFLPDTDLPCSGAGDVDGSGQVNVADLTYLNAYLFHGGPAPPPCP